MILHYEDTEGNVQELNFVPRLPTGQAREQLRVAIADSVKRGKEFDKKNPAHLLNDKLAKAIEENAREGKTIEEKSKANADYVKIAEETTAYNSALNGMKQENNLTLLKLIASNETRLLLTDAMLQSLSMEEVEEIVSQFRDRIKI